MLRYEEEMATAAARSPSPAQARLCCTMRRIWRLRRQGPRLRPRRGRAAPVRHEEEHRLQLLQARRLPASENRTIKNISENRPGCSRHPPFLDRAATLQHHLGTSSDKGYNHKGR